MKISMCTDIEGVAGVVSFPDQSYEDGKYHDQAKRLATGEVNAAVDGLLDAGVEDVLVVDGHGPGGLNFEELHEAARLIHGRPSAPRSVRDPVVAEYDACVMIGQHAMAGVPTSNQNHTQSSRSIDYYKLNGKPIGEIAQFGLYHGAFGIPLIFLSGEDDACREAEDLVPGITTVSVKQGLSRTAAISVSAIEARRRIRVGITKAVDRHRKHPVPHWSGNNPSCWRNVFSSHMKRTRRHLNLEQRGSMGRRCATGAMRSGRLFTARILMPPAAIRVCAGAPNKFPGYYEDTYENKTTDRSGTGTYRTSGKRFR